MPRDVDCGLNVAPALGAVSLELFDPPELPQPAHRPSPAVATDNTINVRCMFISLILPRDVVIMVAAGGRHRVRDLTSKTPRRTRTNTTLGWSWCPRGPAVGTRTSRGTRGTRAAGMSDAPFL